MTLSTEAIETLTRHAFPGNVRELENILERALALCEGERIEVADLYLPRTEAPAASPDTPDEPDEPLPLEASLREIEKRAILDALDATHWDQVAACRTLKMTPRSLRYRLARLRIE